MIEISSKIINFFSILSKICKNLDKILDRRKYTSDDFPTSFGSSPRWWVHPAKVKKYYEHKGSDGDFSYISLSVSIDGNVFINAKQDK